MPILEIGVQNTSEQTEGGEGKGHYNYCVLFSISAHSLNENEQNFYRSQCN